MNSNLAKILSFSLLAFILGKNIYSDFISESPKELLKKQIEEYFVENDEKVKLTWFDAQGKTISLALEISDDHFSSNDIKLLKRNSRVHIIEKVCSSPSLREFIEKGNYISVDVRTNNGFTKHLQNINMAKGKCV